MQALHRLLLFHVLTWVGQNAHGGEIIRGDKAPKNSLLYMVSLQNNRGQHMCGGFLISQNFVATAAHCDVGLSRAVVGTHNLRKIEKTKVRNIGKRYKHPSYVDVGYGNDIMLLKLSHGVELDNSVQTIPLPSSDMNIRDDEPCSVAGWGSVTTGRSPGVPDLRVVNVSVINPRACMDKWHGLPDNVICAGGFGTKKGFCQGDSGGPLVCNGKAVGVVSFNRAAVCNYPDLPNVYTDISKFLPWIKNILKGTEHYD